MPRHRAPRVLRGLNSKAAALVAGLLVACMLAACGPQRGTSSQSSPATHTGAVPQTAAGDKPLVLTTFTVLADIARNVAGDHLEVESLTKPGAEIHGYEPTPGDLKRVADADLVINNGMNLEVWFEQFMADAKAPRVTASEGVEVINIASDAYAGKPNPHAWMSPLNAQTYVDNLAAAFTALEPEHGPDFHANAELYKQQLEALHEELTEGVSALPQEQRALVTCEGAFSYLAKGAGLTEHYIWPVNADNQATPQQISDVIKFVKDNRVPAVFCESTVSADPMMRVAESSGAQFGGTLYVDSLSLADGPVPTYLDLIRHDVKTIVNGLTGNTQ